MDRRYRLAAAVLGLAGVVAWFAYGLVLDAQLKNHLDEAVLHNPTAGFWVLRIGLAVAALALACLALSRVVRERPARKWFFAVAFVLLLPLTLRGLPLRWAFLPSFLLSALYLALAILPERETKTRLDGAKD
jgi:hypothetical protein